MAAALARAAFYPQFKTLSLKHSLKTFQSVPRGYLDCSAQLERS